MLDHFYWHSIWLDFFRPPPQGNAANLAKHA